MHQFYKPQHTYTHTNHKHLKMPTNLTQNFLKHTHTKTHKHTTLFKKKLIYKKILTKIKKKNKTKK